MQRDRLNLSEWALRRQSLVLFLLLLTLVVGAFSFTRLGRLEDPLFNVPAMTAVVLWPGASALEVQAQVLDKMELELQKIEGIDQVKSFARQGYGGFTFWMKGGTKKEGLEHAWYLARKKIGDIRHTFPAGVQGPLFNDEYGDVYSVTVALSAQQLALAQLQELAKQLKRSMQQVPGITKVETFGKQAERVFVEFDSNQLAALGISPQQLAQALSSNNDLRAAGAIETSVDRVHVRLSGHYRSLADIGQVLLTAGDRQLRIKDVAKVQHGFEDPANFRIRHNGSQVLLFGLNFQRSGNLLQIGAALDQQLASLQASLPLGVTLEKVADQPKVVADSVWEFERSFLEALVIVMAVCLFALGLRTGVIVAMSVPLVLAMVATVMMLMDWNLDRISLGALIIALGLLVDDAIIAVEMMVVKMEQGFDRFKAATFAYTSTAFPMLTGTLVTVAGFMPVGFAKSISGEYAGGIFWVVGVALLASWLVAVIFIPYLGVRLLPDHPAQHQPQAKASLALSGLQRLLEWSVRHKKTVLGMTAGAFVLALAGMTIVQKQFFPSASRTELVVDLRMPEGTAFAAMEAQVIRFERLLQQQSLVSSYTSYIGAGAPRFFLSLSGDLPNPAFAQVIVNTRSLADREVVRADLLRLFKEDKEFPALRGRVSRFEFGPPVGFPVQFRVIGADSGQLKLLAARVRDQLRQSPLLRDVQLDWHEQVRALRVELSDDKLGLLGLNHSELADSLQLALSGVAVSQLRRGDELVDVVLRAWPGERDTVEQLQDLNLFTRSGTPVQLSQVADVQATFEEPVLWRRNRDMAITVRADVTDGVQGPYATKQVWPLLAEIISQLPPGYRIEIGGAAEEVQKSDKALFAVFPAMFAVMLLLLMVQLQSFSRMWLVFMTAPLAMIGVVPALLLFNAPFGFVALLGVIALGGMIMRNSLILVDQIDVEIGRGLSLQQAVVTATLQRTRPVLLTAAAAVLAMIPLVSSVFWGPMAIAIMGGLVVGTLLTLVFVPTLYAAMAPKPVAVATYVSV